MSASFTKTALVTGANKGIGLEIARQLSDCGFRVLVSGRNLEAVREASSTVPNSIPLQMDVADGASIRKAYSALASDHQKLYVLVNNAGILLDEGESVLQTPADAILATLRTNTIGPLLVSRTFLPLMEKGSRIINVSSEAGAISNGMSTYAPVYSISKTALNAVTCQLALAIKRKGIPVNSVCPGWVRTSMGGMMAPRSVKKGAETAVWLATEAPLNETGKFWRDKKVIPW